MKLAAFPARWIEPAIGGTHAALMTVGEIRCRIRHDHFDRIQENFRDEWYA